MYAHIIYPTSHANFLPPTHLHVSIAMNACLTHMICAGCLTCWCPCITFGKVAEIVDRGSTSCGTSGALYALLGSLTGCHWIYSCTYRSKMRAQYALPDDPCCDCCVHFCCEPCGLIQQYKELKARGYDPDIGWHLNLERGNGGTGAGGVNPPGMQEMGR
ncbi:unnamed protein product [Triticum turgidum subsp. durum]|uniref:Uncharacterized protein n=1 Tax=Triticum turgidum subsp. durum TaxID=4567 RepID=A0A9R1ATC3_TRITD|nr:unnamed protein product [Triticum turgidum subsp. durum]